MNKKIKILIVEAGLVMFIISLVGGILSFFLEHQAFVVSRYVFFVLLAFFCFRLVIWKFRRYKGRSRFYKTAVIFSYLIPLMIVVYVLYMNILPFGFEKTYVLDVGNPDDEDCSKGLCITEWEGSETMRVGDETFRILEGEGKISLDPDVIIDNKTKITLRLKNEEGIVEIKFDKNSSWITAYMDNIKDYRFMGRVDGVNVYVHNRSIQSYKDKKDYIKSLVLDNSAEYFMQPRYYLGVFSDDEMHPLIDMPFDEPPVDGLVMDKSGNANHGILGGKDKAKYPEWASENNDGYYNFDGHDDYIEVKNINITKELSFDTAVRFASDPKESNTKIFSDNRQYGLYARGSSDELRFFIQKEGGDYCPPAIIKNENIRTGEWYELRGVYDGTQAKIYLNNQLKDIVNCPGTVMDSDDRIFAIGRRENLDGQNLNGSLSRLKIYNKSLEPELILSKNIQKTEEQDISGVFDELEGIKNIYLRSPKIASRIIEISIDIKK
ncbi:hypothetical protein GF336_03895 [Candidatus Woesearchaeota archaeon]|nr:hypothetical protein [Candidatus Woesearchaeota archaeon]